MEIKIDFEFCAECVDTEDLGWDGMGAHNVSDSYILEEDTEAPPEPPTKLAFVGNV